MDDLIAFHDFSVQLIEDAIRGFLRFLTIYPVTGFSVVVSRKNET